MQTSANMFTGLRRRWRKADLYSVLVSIGAHMVVLGLMMCFSFQPPSAPKLIAFESALEEPEEQVAIEEVIPQPTAIEEQPAQIETVATDVVSDVVGVSQAAGDPNADTDVSMPSFDSSAVGMLAASNVTGVNAGRGMGENLRGRGNKDAMLGTQGGTRGTERAVRIGLDWLVRHQHPDGHWSLDHTKMAKQPSTGKGSAQADMGATCLALLPFLAANYTHKEGPHKQTVARGLDWIIKNRQPDGYYVGKGDAFGMYNHGLATIVLCEAFGLSQDRTIRGPAEQAVQFLARTQNGLNGWRYAPDTREVDTSVFGWQLMGLKSAQMAGISVPAETLERCKKYLKFAGKGKNGGLFVYDPTQAATGPSPNMTAVGLLCLQYLGSRRDDAAIQEGVDYMLKRFPPDSHNDCYYWYYATQVVHNYQGPEWDRWNRAVRRLWVERQNAEQKSDDYGSWDPKDFPKDHSHEAGGRHYITAVGLLTLEVYYRFLPLYKVMDGEKSASEESSSKSDASAKADKGKAMAKDAKPGKTGKDSKRSDKSEKGKRAP